MFWQIFYLKIAMKLNKIVLVCACILIVVLAATASFNSIVDGNDAVGFPFTFYEYLGGKRFPEPTTRYNFNFFACAIDLILLFGGSFVGLIFYQRRQLTKKK